MSFFINEQQISSNTGLMGAIGSQEFLSRSIELALIYTSINKLNRFISKICIQICSSYYYRSYKQPNFLRNHSLEQVL